MEKAVYPDRVRFAIFQQNEENESDCADFSDICGPKGSNPAHIICSRKNAIKIRRVHCKQAKGPLWARANHDEMIGADEDFAMQIDCHSLFTERWDEKILKMWYRCKNEYAVITYYPRDVRTSMVEGRNIGVNDNIVVFGRFTFEVD